MPSRGLPSAACHVVVTASAGIAITFGVWLVRLFVRTTLRKPFDTDDIHCTIATFCGILNSALAIGETDRGLGQRESEIAPWIVRRQQQMAWVANMSFILALCFAILSVSYLLVRITKLTSLVRVTYAVPIATSLWAVVAFCLITFQCKLPDPWDFEPQSRCIDIVSCMQHSSYHDLRR